MQIGTQQKKFELMKYKCFLSCNTNYQKKFDEKITE